MRLAHGGFSFVCTRRLPMVSSRAAAISDLGFDAPDHHLDCEHYLDVRPMAFERTWRVVGVASELGNAAGIRMRGSGRCSSRIAADQTIGRSPRRNGVGSTKDGAPNSIPVSGSSTPSSYIASVQIH